MDNFKELLQEKWKLFAIIGGVVLLVIAVLIATTVIFSDDKEEQNEEQNELEEQVTKIEDDEQGVTDETDAIKTSEDEEDVLTDMGLYSVFDIQNNDAILEDYTTYLTDVESLLNGLSVGFSVMDSVFTDISTMANAEALKNDFNTAIPEYQQIFELLKGVETTDYTQPLNEALINLYIDMFGMRKSEADNIQEIGGSLIVDYTKVGYEQDEITNHYQKILEVHTALTNATGVYIGDGVSN